MRFRKVKLDKTSNVIMEHAGQELAWNVKILDTNTKRIKNGQEVIEEDPPTPADPFEQVNQFIVQLPIPTQNELFGIYSTIHGILEPHGHDSVQDLRKKLSPHLKRIFELCPPDSIARWIRMTPTIIFPSNIRVYSTIEESAQRGDQFGLQNRPAAATYIEKDYWGLVTTVMLTRMLVPIWGRFLGNIFEYVNNNFKEMYALRLVTKTPFVETDGYKRLEDYINHYLTPDKFRNSAMEGNVPKEDAPFQTISILLVRRLAWVDFSGRDPSFSLVGKVYSFINQHLDGTDRQYNERVKPKIPDNGVSGNDQENRASVSELIKIREAYPAGDLTLPESAARMPELFINRMHPEMLGENWLTMALQAVEPLKRVPPQAIQFTMLQNVLGGECRQLDGQWEVDPRFRDRWDALFPPRAIDEMNLIEDLNMMAVGTALLCYRGFYDIAALMTASPAKDRYGNSLGKSPPPLALTDDHQKLLQRHFPYAQRLPNTRRSNDPRTAKLANVASTLIDTICEDLTQYQWVLNIPNAWIKLLPNHDGTKRYTVKSDFRNRFAELAISIATRSF